MFDEPTRRLKNALLTPVARGILFLTPTQLSLIGLLMAGFMFAALYQQNYVMGLVFWWLNRLFDGLDGIVAREQSSQSDFGGYVDIVCDFIAYALLPIGLVMGMQSQQNWIALVILLATFYVNSASWMYLSALLEKRNLGTAARGETTSITMPQGLVAGFETIVFFSLFVIAPQYLIHLFGLMTAMVIGGIIQRFVWAYRNLGA